MPRRRVVAAREILPDPKFGSQTIAKFMNHVMKDGKKSIAFTITIYPDSNMSDKELLDIQDKVIKAVESKCGAKLRA